MAIETKQLDFSFNIRGVQFNHLGKFYLKLTIQSSYTRAYSGLKFRKGPLTEPVDGHSACTDVVEQAEKNKFYSFKDTHFLFTLPKGFCKNDSRYDVFLLVEAFSVSEEDSTKSKRVGEAKFAIFPRTDTPRVNTQARPGQEIYSNTDVLTMLRTLSMEQIQMHCGRLKYSAMLKTSDLPPISAAFPPRPVPPMESDPLPPPPSRPKPRSPATLKPTPFTETYPQLEKVSPVQDKMINDEILLPLSSSPEAEASTSQVHLKSPDEPQSAWSVEQWTSEPQVTLVSKPGKEEVLVIIHGASGLPPTSQGGAPVPYVLLSTGSGDSLQQAEITCASLQPTYNPMWEEMLCLQLEQRTVLDQVLVIRIADKNSREILVTYKIPLSYLVPFHHYHLEMLMMKESSSSTSGVRLYATIIRKSNMLPTDMSSPNYVGLEVLLEAMEEQLKNPVGPITALARVVPDYFSYKSDTLLPHSAGIALTSVTFPSPHPASFAVSAHQTQGYPQVTLPGHPQERPHWTHRFFFGHQRDKATLFTPGAALVIELYSATAAMADMSWRLRSPVGFATLLLDQTVFRQLTSQHGSMGLKVEGLPVQRTKLRSRPWGKTPTLGLALRLILTERPDMLGSLSSHSQLPVLNTMTSDSKPDYYHSNGGRATDGWYSGHIDSGPPSPLPFGFPMLQRKPKMPPAPLQDGELPPHDAIESILPEYQYIFVDPDNKGPPRPTVPSKLPEDMEKTGLNLLEHQMRELENYRTAVHKMGQDILTLRQQIRDLESTNSQLRRDLAKYNDSTRLLLDSQELDGLSKPELAARYVAIKQKLGSQTNELRSYKEKVTKLQNDLIRKNDKEKEYLKMSHAHLSQQEILQKLQDKATKVKKLEEACKKQEKVIEKMERLLYKAGKDTGNQGANDALMEENRRLRSQVEDLQEQMRGLSRNSGHEDTERLELYEKLEKSDGRIMSLEKQLADNARQWGRDKADLLLKLQEADHGISRSTPVFHDYPKINTNKSFDGGYGNPRRYSKAPGAKKGKSSLRPIVDY